MIEVRKTEVYAKWESNLRDLRARARVQARVERLIHGNPVALSRWVTVFRNCVSIMAPVSTCTTSPEAAP